jgi:hypothetical protein
MKMNKILLTIHVLAAVARPTVLGKWEEASETDSLIALQGTIYSTSMYSRTEADNTRADILDAANEGWSFKCAAIAGRIMIMLRGDTINETHAHV